MHLFFSDHDVGMQHTCEVEAEPACATEYRAATCPSQQLHLAECESYQPGTHAGMWLYVLVLFLAAVSSLNNTRRLFDGCSCSCTHVHTTLALFSLDTMLTRSIDRTCLSFCMYRLDLLHSERKGTTVATVRRLRP